MALSNIFREPRREITETLIGAAVFIPIPIAAYKLAQWLVTTGVMILMHSVGEKICNFLTTRGLELRPKVRPR